jgi:hypothetical protein
VSKPVKRRRKPLRVYEPGSGAAASDWFVRVQRAMKELERNGHVEDPALRARIRAGWDPATEIAVMSTRPGLSEMVEFGCYKVLNDRRQRDAEMRQKSTAPGDLKVSIVVAPWAAAGKPSAQALPAPKEIDPSDVLKV